MEMKTPLNQKATHSNTRACLPYTCTELLWHDLHLSNNKHVAPEDGTWVLHILSLIIYLAQNRFFLQNTKLLVLTNGSHAYSVTR